MQPSQSGLERPSPGAPTTAERTVLDLLRNDLEATIMTGASETPSHIADVRWFNVDGKKNPVHEICAR